MTDTPRTDAELMFDSRRYTWDEVKKKKLSGWRGCVGDGFARQLERELGAARDQLAEQTARANHHEERATEALRDLASVTRERDALRGLDASHNDEYRSLRAENETLTRERDGLRKRIRNEELCKVPRG